MEVSELVSSTRQFVDEIERYRDPWESRTHWHARKTFLKHNWDNFEDKQRIISLSAAWANVHFMGNRYPEKVMKQLKEMEKGIPNAEALLIEAEKQVTGISESSSVIDSYPKLPPGMVPMKFVKETSEEKSIKNLSHKVVKNNELSFSGHPNISEKNKKTTKNIVLAPRFPSPMKNKSLCLSSTKPSLNTFDVSLLKQSCEDVHQTFQSSSFQNTSKTITSIEDNFANQLSSQKQCKSKDDSTVCVKKPRGNNFGFDIDKIRTFIRKLSSLIRSTSSSIDSGTKTSIFVQYLHQLKENPNFQYSTVKRNHIILFQKWGKENKCPLNLTCGTWVCDLYVKDVFISQGYGSSKILSRNFAVDGAVALLGMDYVDVVRARRVRDDGSLVLQMAATIQQRMVNLDSFPPILSSELNEQSILNSSGIDIPVPKNFVIKMREGSNAITVLTETAQCNRVTLDHRFEPDIHTKWKCIFALNGFDIANGDGVNQKEAKLAAATAALDILKENYPTIYGSFQRPGNVDEAISRNELLQKSNPDVGDSPISDLNIGNRLLRKMGWSGSGGLGKSGEGIADPVHVVGTHNRTGLGSKQESYVSMKDAQNVLRNFVRKGCVGELTFSSELTSDERKQIHSMAHRFGLQSRSYGKGENRHLVVFLKKSSSEMVDALEKAGGKMGGLHLLNPTRSSDD